MLRLKLHVTPKSGRDEVVGWRGDELQVRVTAPPEDGKANAAVCKTLAAALGVPKSAVRVTRGDTSRHKIIEVDGASDADAATVFGRPDASLF